MSFENQNNPELNIKNPEKLTDNLMSFNIMKIEENFQNIEKVDVLAQTERLNTIFTEELSKKGIDFNKILNKFENQTV